MSQATPACPDSVRNSSNFLSHDDFIVETLTPHGWRAFERRGEPELFTRSSARDVAEAWAVSFNVETRVRSDVTGEVIDTDEVDDGPTPAEMYAMWLAQRRIEEDEDDRRSYERGRRAVMAPILERAIEDEAKYGIAA